jgi:signal recognition particle subunit SRP14
MYERHASSGYVSITMKRSSLKPRKTKKAPPPPEDYRCLIRASDGKKTISTTVPTTQHAKFAGSINVIMKVCAAVFTLECMVHSTAKRGLL